MDLVELFRRDHDELVLALTCMLAPATSDLVRRDALDGLRLGLAVHAAAEARVLARIVRLQPVPAIRAIAVRARRDHMIQQDAVDFLSCLDVGSDDWHEHVKALRDRVAEHALRGDAVSIELRDCLPGRLFVRLPGQFATERMQVFATTSPILLAAQLHEAAI
jgi:hypothetical protein